MAALRVNNHRHVTIVDHAMLTDPNHLIRGDRLTNELATSPTHVLIRITSAAQLPRMAVTEFIGGTQTSDDTDQTTPTLKTLGGKGWELL